MDGRSEAQGLRAKTQEALSDSQLDRRLEAALGIEPSPEFLARVRTRIAADPSLMVESGFSRIRPTVESGFSRIRQLAFEPLWGVAIAGIVLAIVVPQWMRDEIETTHDVVQTAARDVDRTLFPQQSNSVAAVVNARPVRVVRRTAVGEPPLRLSPVLFSDEERRALARLVMAVEEGLVPPLPETTQVNDQTGEVRELRIAPLMIDPLPMLARVEIEGEGQW